MIVGRNYLHDANKNKGACSIVFRPTIPASGEYEIALYAQPHSNRAAKVPVTVLVGGEVVTTVHVNQRDASRKARHSLGEFDLPRGRKTEVRIENKGTTGVVVVDALQIVGKGVEVQ